MTQDEIFDAWAPADSAWSAWVKPVLFAHVHERPADEPVPSPPDLAWLAPSRETALVVDLPGADGVAYGLALAGLGWRPVPLYNAVPAHAPAKVEVWPIVRALERGAPRLNALSLAPDAPPAFLLDAHRRGLPSSSDADFDNRSVSFPTDFPSGTMLRSRGITRAILVQPSGLEPQADLAHTLRRWQDAGITVETKALDRSGGPEPIRLRKPWWPRLVLYRFLMLMGLRRHVLGGFGGRLSSAVG